MESSEPGQTAPQPAVRTFGLPDDAAVVAGLRSGDEETFAYLVDAWSPTMLHVARGHVISRETAADVVQETWLAVVRGIGSFEQRSTLRTWVFRILANIAKTTGTRERRTIMRRLADDDQLPSVPAHRFRDADDDYPGGWRTIPEPWTDLHAPEAEAMRSELRITVAAAIRSLPARQRLVVTMRDLDGFASSEVCELLGLTPANQRVLLHRGRSAVRTLLEMRFGRAARWSATS